MCLAQGPQRSDAGEARTRVPSASTLPLSHCAPTKLHLLFAVKQQTRPGPEVIKLFPCSTRAEHVIWHFNIYQRDKNNT